MPTRLLILITTGTLALAACSVRTHDDNGAEASITIGNGGGGSDNGQQSVAINVPGFSAKVNVPDLDIGGDTKIEDMPLYPGTKVNRVNISANGSDGTGGESSGSVNMGFTAPGKATEIVDWYRDQAQKNGWTAAPPSGGNQFEATKRESGHGTTHFALQVADAGTGSSGRFIVTGR